jgi:hypothetical protein
MRAQHLIIALGQGLVRFGKEPGRHLTSDSRQRQHHRSIRWLLTFAGRLSQGAQHGTDLLATGLKWIDQHPQTQQQEPTMGLSGFGGTRGNGQSWRL